MAPGEPNQKRKRGRPPGASRVAEAATEHNPKDVPTGEPDAAPKKRGRPRKSVAEHEELPANQADQPEPTEMAPKKRGRPRKSVAEDEELPAANQIDQTEAPEIAPKKRGRPRKSVNPMAEDEELPAESQADQTEPSTLAPKKRGRPPKARGPEPEEGNSTEMRPRKRRRADEAEEETENGQQGHENRSSKPGKVSVNAPQEAGDPEEQSTAETTSRRSRGNRHPDDSPAQPSPREPVSNTVQAKKAKGKPGRKPAGRVEPAAEDNTTEDTARRSRRERRSADDKPWWMGNQQSPEAAGTMKEAPGPQKPKRGRPSLAEVAISNAQNQAGPSQTEPKQQEKRRGRPPRAANEADSPKEAANNPQQQQKAPPKKPTNRRPSPSPEPTPTAAPDPLANHRHLSTLTRQIPRSTITSKWTPLDTPSITAISSLLTDSTLPILHRLRDRDARHAQAQSILRTFSARLHSKLTKGMPFPPASIPVSRPRGRTTRKGGGATAAAVGSHEAELDFEKTVDAIAGLEKALDPLLHSVVLLRAEKEREERALEREYEALRRLEGNARAQVRGWREGPGGRGREHVLVGGIGGGREGEGRGLGEVVVKAGGGGEPVFKDLQEEELLALSQQIGNHMESMRSNLGQIEGVLPAIAKSKAALQGTLCEHLDPEQYEQVLLG